MAKTNQEKQQETYLAAERALRRLDPAEVAVRTDCAWHRGAGEEEGLLEVPALQQKTILSWPSMSFQQTSVPLLGLFPWRLITLHYLAGAPGTRPDGHWLGYRELPDGMFYAGAVQRDVEAPLAQFFAAKPEALREIGFRIGAQEGEVGDVSLLFHPFPLVPVVITLWEEDEEFPAEAKILYDRAGSNNLPLQDLRILADLLAATLQQGAE